MSADPAAAGAAAGPAAGAGRPAVQDPLDLTIANAAVFDGERLLDADTVTVSGGTVTGIGRGLDPVGRVVDAHGALLAPGFVDAHAHPVFAGVEALAFDVSQTTSAAEVLAAVRTALPQGEGWLTGGGWSMAHFPGGAPLASQLDEAGAAVGSDRPIQLINRDHHSAWVNTAALRIAGIDRTTQPPPGGVIERDEHGEPTGTLHESAMDLVAAHIPPESPEELRAGLLHGQAAMHGLGITGYIDAIVGDYSGHGDSLAAYVAAEAAGELTMEVNGSLWWGRDIADVEAEAARLAARRVDSPRLRTTQVKFMLDGIVESMTAAMAQPYRCACGGTGTQYFAREHLRAAFAAISAAGLDIHCHAIGDAASTEALDAFEALAAAGDRSDARHHIAHIQVVDPADIPRFAQLGITANMQALWACYEDQMVELNMPVLGEERSGWQYPFGDLARAGAPLAMGSDWPVSSPDPWQAIHVAVNRSHPTAVRPEPLLPHQALRLETALAAYTSGSARLARTHTAGRLRVGAPADFALADANPFALPAQELHTVGTLLTAAGGRLVHADPQVTL